MQHYDYVVIGAGPAGCVLAARLTENPKLSVLLLESGPRDRHPFIHIPAGYAKLKPTSLNWGYSTVPQAHLDNRTLWYPQGRVVGGGSSINAMIYTRGAKSDYDEWAAAGCSEWSYEKVLPTFVSAENNARLSSPYHGNDGPLCVSDPISPHPITREMVKAVQQMGVPFTADFNGERQDGVGFHQTTTFRGRRASAAVCYLKPALGRPNLTLVSGATVERIVFEGRRATQVRFFQGRKQCAVGVGAEVLVTSGAIGSPKLMMLSGVGPAADLRRLGIDVVADLPGVGENLQEHFNVPVVAELNGPLSYYGRDQLWRQGLWTLQYLLYGTGPLTTTVGEAGAFIRTEPTRDAPDVQVHLMAAPVMPHGIERIAGYGITVASNVLRPRSRGTVKLRSRNAADPPLIDPNFLDDPDDLARGIAGLEFTRALLETPALRKLVKAELVPGPTVRTQSDLVAFVRRTGKMDYHPVGTCRMGVDSSAVVDQQLRVTGLDNVRVCDSSVMLTQISGNTNAPTIMIAERASQFITGTQTLHSGAANGFRRAS